MANVINQLLASAPRAQSAAPYAQLASDQFNKGLQGLVTIGEKLDTNRKNAAVSQILSMDPLDDPSAYQSALTDRLSQVAGMDPVMALNLAAAKAKPVFEERKRKEALAQLGIENAYRDTTLGETIRHNQATENKAVSKGYGAVTTDDGITWTYNKDTGDFNKSKGNTSGSGSRINSKDIVLKTVTVKDGQGNEITKTYPVNKRTNNIVEDGIDTGKELPSTVKRPTVTQADRDAILATKNAMTSIEDIGRQYDPKIVGPIDNAISWGLNKAGVNSDRAAKNRNLNQTIQNLKANLTDALIKGVPSDRDLAMIEDMLPSTSDSEIVFKRKLDNIKKILTKQTSNLSEQQKERGIDVPVVDNNKGLSASGKPMIKVNGRWHYAG